MRIVNKDACILSLPQRKSMTNRHLLPQKSAKIFLLFSNLAIFLAIFLVIFLLKNMENKGYLGQKRRHSEKPPGQISRGRPPLPPGPLLEPVASFQPPQYVSKYHYMATKESKKPSSTTTSMSMSMSTSKGTTALATKNHPAPTPRKDLSQFLPLKKFLIPEDHTRIYTVANGITDETIVVTSGQFTICLYRLRVTEFKDEPGKKRDVELIKVHEIEFDNRIQGYFAISSECSVTLPPRKLVYAVAPFGSHLVYYLDFKEENNFAPDKINLDDVNLQEKHGDSLKIFDNGQPCTEMAIKNDHYLACILANQVVVVWEISTETKLCSFQLAAEGVHISWHPSENYKLFVVEASGFVKFFNVMKERCYMVEYMCHNPLYSGDWAASNSLFGVVGWAGGMTCFNSSQSNTNMFQIHEQSCKVFKRVRFNPTDNRSIATLERGFVSPTTIRLWRSHLPHFLWSHSSEQIVDIAWMFGKPYLIALAYKKILVFDASTNS